VAGFACFTHVVRFTHAIHLFILGGEYIYMNKQLQNFFDKTKQLHILLCIALLLILFILVAPIGKGFLKYSGQVVIIVLLIYVLFKNFTETHNFVLVQKNIKNEKDMNEDIKVDLKNNTIASYVLCGFILILLLYVIYSLFD
jgi:Ca2+/H+ antiporter